MNSRPPLSSRFPLRSWLGIEIELSARGMAESEEIKSTIDGIVDLRLAALNSHSFFVGSETAKEKIRKFVADAVCSATKSQSIKVLTSGQTVRAHITIWHNEDAWCGSPMQTCLIDYIIGDQEALAWTKRNIEIISKSFCEHFDLCLDSAYGELFPFLLSSDLALDSVILLGRVQRALEWISKSRVCTPGELGLQLRPMEEKDVDAIMSMETDIYTRHPEFCWFGANPKYLKTERERLEAGHGANNIRYVVEEMQTVVGYGGSEVEENAFWGRCGGMHFVIAPHWQRRGVGKLLYSRILSDLHALNAESFKGGTAQPAIMKLSEYMGREAVAWNIRRRGHFEIQHFEAFVPSLNFRGELSDRF